MTTTGFYSVVLDRESAGRGIVVVRARSRNDLERLRRRFKIRKRVEATPLADYPYRLFLRRQAWMDIAAELAGDAVRYANFKEAVAKKDKARAETYAKVWSVLRAIEQEGA